VVDRGFVVERESHRVPGVLLTPEPSEVGARFPLVLIGHGRTLHSRHAAPYSVARRLARRDGVAVALIDLPGHGDRPGSEEELPHGERRELAAADWMATLDGLLTLEELDVGRVGYWGLSLGTDYGLPFVASDERVGVAVLGLYGTRSSRIGDTDALGLCAQVRCPVLYVMQWDDAMFDRDGQLEVFDAIGSEDKRLISYPGGHDETPDEGLRLAREFLVRELSRAGEVSRGGDAGS
jgi:dienelactone hydrolase